MKRVLALVIFLGSLCLIVSLQSCGEELDTEDVQLSSLLESYLDDKGILPIIAHRGCWSGDSVPQNSLAAFRKALELNILGTEFDVHQTLDGKLVINHGAAFDSATISKTTYEDLCQHRLGNGETIPLLEDFLRTYVAVETNVLLVVDLKSCNLEHVIKMLKQYDVLSRVMFVSFSKNYCNQLFKRGLGQVTSYLGGNITPQEALNAGYGGINYSQKVYKAHPEWIDEAKALGLKVGVWTVNDEKNINNYVNDSVIVTTDYVTKIYNNRNSYYDNRIVEGD